jgi:pimeloyl-ACP methyl ester carboxylesterase
MPRSGVAGAVIAAALVGGCGGSSPPARTPVPTATAVRATGPEPLDRCDAAGAGWKALATTGQYSPSSAAQLGRGNVGVVFANDSNNDACDWSAEARSLASRGYAVAVFDASIASESRQALAVARALRVRRIVVIGASVGARAVLQLGAAHPPGVVGLVAMSAERRIGSNPSDLLPIARKVRVPVLTIGSREDAYTSFGKDTAAWHRTIPHDKLVLLSGGDHGVELFSDRHGPRVRAAILAFLRSLAIRAERGPD